MKAIYTLVFVTLILVHVTNCFGQVAVIAHKDVKQSSIDKEVVEKIYKLLKKNWDDGNKIVVFDLKDNDNLEDSFYSYLGENHNKMKKLWLKKQLTGEGTAPKAFGSENAILEKVAETDGAIGFISAAKVTDAVQVLFEIK